jgi:serine protease
MNGRVLSILILTSAFILMTAFSAFGFKDSFNVLYDGHEASGTTAIVSFTATMNLADIRSGLKDQDIAIHSMHTTSGLRFSPGDIKNISSYKAADFTFLLVEFHEFDLSEAMRRLKSMPNVEDVSPNWVSHSKYYPNDPYYDYQTNFTQIDVESAWDLSDGSGVMVAVIDSGFRTAGMEDEPRHLLSGYDFWGNDSNVRDYIGHGTHVANTVAERTGNNIGAAGLAFEASILPIKVFPDWDEGAYEDDIIDGIYWAVDQGAEVINMSLGGGDYVSQSNSACNYARDQNVVIFAAAGNDGVAPIEYPAAYDSVVAVGSSRPHNPGSYPSRSDFSNYGSDLDILAPGEEIVQETFDPSTGDIGYYMFDGTSSASPHAAAVAALMISNGAYDADDIVQTIFETAFKSGSGWDNQLGWGEINAWDAVRQYDGPTDDDDDNDDDNDDDIDDDDSDDDNDDDINDDDDDDNPWADDDDGDDDDGGEAVNCSDVLSLIYDECHYAFLVGDSRMPGEEAWDYCNDGVGDWVCVEECIDHPDVEGCEEFGECLAERCQMPVGAAEGQDGDDDDDGGSGRSCSFI